MAVNPIPQGYHSVTPYLIIDGAAEAIRFYSEAFGAVEMLRMPMPVQSDAAGGVAGGGRIAHAEIKIGDSHVMLSDEWPDMDLLGPARRGGATASLMIYLADVDLAFQRALDAGAIEERAVADQFWGDRMGTVVDPFGHRWTLSTHVEDVPEEEMQRRMQAMASEMA